MERIIIEEVKVGISDGGMACGPVDGAVIASVKFREGDVSKWITNSEFDGYPAFTITDEDVFDILMDIDKLEENQDIFESSLITEFHGVQLEDYEDMLESFDTSEDSQAVALIRFVVGLTRCDRSDEKAYLEHKGRYADEFDHPFAFDLDLD